MKPDEAYCVRCNVPRRMYHPVERALSHGRMSLVDKCSVCGATLSRLKESDVRDPYDMKISPRRLSRRDELKRDQAKGKWLYEPGKQIRRGLICRICGQKYLTFLSPKRDCGRCGSCYGQGKEAHA